MRLFLVFLLSLPLFAQNPTYRFHTNVGDIDVLLTPDVAPLTVANFLAYVNAGAYVNSIFHRSVPGFIIQAGGYQLQSGTPVPTPQNPPVQNEFNVTNARGTIAMAKLGTDPNSATSQWFFNLANNGANLDNQDGGFTVFGHITNSAGLAIMDRIGNYPTYNLDNGAFSATPLNNGNLLLVTSIVPLPTTSAAGFLSAASFASTSVNGISPGELLTIYGTNLGPAQTTTLTVANGVAANLLAGTQVLFNSTPGTMIFTSNGQLSVIAPYNLTGKTSVTVGVIYQGTESATLAFPVVAANPAIFTLNSSGKGDGAIVRLDGSDVTTMNPASVGDTLVLFGEGYGATTPALPDGTIVGTTLPMPSGAFQLLIDGQPVPTLYVGGAPSLVNGVLQVNFVVPQLNAGSHSIQMQVGTRTSPAGVNLQTR